MFPYLLQLFKEEIPFLVHEQYRNSTDYMPARIKLLSGSVDLGDKCMETSIPHTLCMLKSTEESRAINQRGRLKKIYK